MVLFVLFWCLSCSGWAEWLHCRPVQIDAFYQDFVHDQLWKHFYFFIKISKTIWCFTRGVITGLQCFKVRHSAQSLGNSIFWNWMADIHLHKVQLFWEGHRNLRNLPHSFDICLVNVKTMRKISQIFVGFSEMLNFILKH